MTRLLETDPTVYHKYRGLNLRKNEDFCLFEDDFLGADTSAADAAAGLTAADDGGDTYKVIQSRERWKAYEGVHAGAVINLDRVGDPHGRAVLEFGNNGTATFTNNGVILVSGQNFRTGLNPRVDIVLGQNSPDAMASTMMQIALTSTGGILGGGGGFELPFQGITSTDNVAANAASACGFIYDTVMSNPQWFGVVVPQASTVAAVIPLGVVPASEQPRWLSMLFTDHNESDTPGTLGEVVFLINGIERGRWKGNVLPNQLNMALSIGGFKRNGTDGMQMGLDYARVIQERSIKVVL